MEVLNVGIIGCGNFATNTNQYLMANPLYNIYASCDIVEEAAKKIAEKTNAAYHTTDVDKIFTDKNIDVVFITTRHDSHAPLSVKAANAKKHVFCEKPMALSREECRLIVKAVKDNNVKYCVGYNRGWAPMITKARCLLAAQKKPKMIYYRIQDPFGTSHWTHIPEVGGGRFVGEGCHIFDLLCALIDSPPVSVYAAGGTFTNPTIVKIPDSAIVTITFLDGSVCTAMINSDGCSGIPKEGAEIYCDGKGMLMDNFKKLELFGYDGQKKQEWILDTIDKGMEIEFDLFAKSIINDTQPPNGIINAARAAVISYMVNESIFSGKPIVISEKDYIF